MNPAYLGQRRGGLRRLLWAALSLLLIVYVVRHPNEAATSARTLLAGLDVAAEAIMTFIQQAVGSA